MTRTVERLAPDLIDTQGVWMNLSRVALSYHKRTGVPLVITPRGMLDPWALKRSARLKSAIRWWFEDRHLASAAAIRALNADEAKAVREAGIDSPIAIIPNGIDVPDDSQVSPVDARAPILQFLGRLDPKKGLEPLLAAWSKVVKDKVASDWRLRINGWGAPDYVKSLQRLVEAHPAKQSVELGGPVFDDEKSAILKSAAGFILPSFSEGLPMAILEAWSWGSPVLMTRECNLPEGFDAGAAFEISRDPDELAKHILCYMEMQGGARQTMADAGRELVKTRFHIQAVARDLERMYNSLVGSRRLPSDLVFGQ